MVLTRKGLRKVEGVKYNGYKTVFNICTQSGKTLNATGNHPLYLPESGFTVVDDLRIGDKILCLHDRIDHSRNCLKQSKRHLLNFKKKGIFFGNTDTMNEAVVGDASFFMSLYGKVKTALCQKDAKYTTRTSTEETTNSSILNASPYRSIIKSIIRVVFMRGRLKREARACKKIGKTDRECASFARNAEKSLLEDQRMVNLIHSNAIGDTIVSIKIMKQARVWDLQIAEAHEFFANGMLVHNCEWTPGDKSPNRLDALTYALTELMLPKKGKLRVEI
jgi:hypothetical protein